MSKRVITAGKITTDHMTGHRVLQQTTELGNGTATDTVYARSRRGTTGPMMRGAAHRQTIASRIYRRPVL